MPPPYNGLFPGTICVESDSREETYEQRESFTVVQRLFTQCLFKRLAEAKQMREDPCLSLHGA